MAESQVNVIFGAQVGALLTGIGEAKEAIEGLTAPVQSFVSNLSGVAEAIGAAFAVERVVEFAREMGRLGEETQNAAAAIGVTTDKYQEFAGMLQIAGGNAETANRTLERFSATLSSAVSDPTGRAGEALQRLGFSSQQVAKLLSGDVVEAFRTVAQRTTEYAQDVNTISLRHDLFGRGADRLIGLLKANSEEWEKLSGIVKETGSILSGEMLVAMNETDDKFDKLGLTVKRLSAEGFMQLKPIIDGIIDDLTSLVSVAITVIQWLGKLGESFDAVAKDVRDAGRAVNSFARELLGLPPIAYADIPPAPAADAAAGRRLGPPAGKGKDKKETDTRLEEWRDELRSQLEDEKHFFNDSKQEELEFWQAKLAIVGTGTKEDLKLRRQLHTEIFNLEKQLAKQTQQIRLEEVDYAKRVNEEDLNARRQHLQALESLGKINATQRIGFEQQLLGQEITADEEYYHRKEAAAAGDQEKLRKLEQDEYLEHQKLTDKMAELDDQRAIEAKRSWDEIAGSITQAIDTSIMGVIQGTQTIGDAFRKLGMSILEEFVNLGIKKAVSGIFDDIYEAVGGQSVGSLFKSIFGGIFGVATGGLGGGLFGFLGKIFGGGAAAASGGMVAPSAAGGWILPAFQSGGILSILHQNEMVLPSHISQGFQDMFAGGGRAGGGAVININAVDPQHGAQYLMRNADTISAAMRQSGLTGGWTPRSLSAGGR